MAPKKAGKKKKSSRSNPHKHDGNVSNTATEIPETITEASPEGNTTVSSVKSEEASSSRKSNECQESDESQEVFFGIDPEEVESKMSEMNLEAPSSSKESDTGQEIPSKSISEVLGLSGEPEYNLVQHPNISVEELIVNDIISRTKEVGLSPLGFHKVHIAVIVLSGQLANKFVDLLRKRAPAPKTLLVAGPQATVSRQAKMIAEQKVQVICGTADRLNRIMGTKYMRKMTLRVVYFIDAGIMFTDSYYRGAIDRFLSNFPLHTRLFVFWSNETKIERLHELDLQVNYFNLIPYSLVKSMHFYVIIPQKNKDNELEAISHLRERFQNHRMVIYCQMKVAEAISKKLREKYKVNCLTLFPQMNFDQRTKIFRKFLAAKKAILLTTCHFTGMVDVGPEEQVVVINYYLPPMYEYVRRVVFTEKAEQNTPTHFYTLIYEDQVNDLKKLRDQLQLKWIEKTFVLYSQ